MGKVKVEDDGGKWWRRWRKMERGCDEVEVEDDGERRWISWRWMMVERLDG